MLTFLVIVYSEFRRSIKPNLRNLLIFGRPNSIVIASANFIDGLTFTAKRSS